MQCIKRASTLRVSPKQTKPAPRIVFRHGNQDGEIAQFLRARRRVKRKLRKVDSVSPLFSKDSLCGLVDTIEPTMKRKKRYVGSKHGYSGVLDYT
jgi:hypothetical protein